MFFHKYYDIYVKNPKLFNYTIFSLKIRKSINCNKSKHYFNFFNLFYGFWFFREPGSPLYSNNKKEIERLKREEEKKLRKELKEKEKREKEMEKLKRKFGVSTSPSYTNSITIFLVLYI